MKKIFSILVILLTMLLAVSCGTDAPDDQKGSGDKLPDDITGGWGDTSQDKDDTDSSGGNSDTLPSPGLSDGEMAIFNALFDESSHVSIKLDIPDSELKKIQQDYEKYSNMGSKSPIYRMADMVITITAADGKEGNWTIPQVGVRMKGNTSRTSFYSDGDGMYNLIHFKISFQETFDEAEYYGREALKWDDATARKARKNRTFATLEKIDIRWNRNDDTTYIRENYAYELYREFGVLAPHTTLASVDIGKDHAGVWMIYEPVDKVFLEKNLPTEALGGDLYKLGWTWEGATFTSFSSVGVENEDNGEFYVYDLKTNKKTSTHQSLRNLINSINSGSISKERFASLVDIDNFMYYCAVSYMIGNPDDLRNNYNNSYIYFRDDTGKMIVIPYDMDRGLGVNNWNPYGHGMTKDDPFARTNVCGDQRSPLFLKTVCRGGMFVNEYTEALKDVDASDMFTNARFNQSFEIARQLYSAETKTSKTYRNAEWCKFRFDIERTASIDQSKNMSFADYISAKRATLYDAIGNLGNTDTTAPGTNPDVDDTENSGNSGNIGGSGNGDTEGGDSGDTSEDTEVRDPITDCVPYVRSDLTNWSLSGQYKMTDNGDGTFSLKASSTHGFKIKIYDDNSKEWFGSEVLDPNCNVWNAPDPHTNIYLDSGSYTITFDTNNPTIYIVKH